MRTKETIIFPVSFPINRVQAPGTNIPSFDEINTLDLKDVAQQKQFPNSKHCKKLQSRKIMWCHKCEEFFFFFNVKNSWEFLRFEPQKRTKYLSWRFARIRKWLISCFLKNCFLSAIFLYSPTQVYASNSISRKQNFNFKMLYTNWTMP